MFSKISGHVSAENEGHESADAPKSISILLSEPDLTSYTEITDLTYFPYGRKSDSGKFDQESTSSYSIGDLFYTPVGTDIVFTINNTNIVPYLYCGDDYQSLTDQVAFIRHPGAKNYWFYSRTTKVCNYIGLQYVSDRDSERVLTAEELRNAEPRLYIRFPSKVINTQMAARIRAKGVKASYQRLFTVVHLTDTHGDMDSTVAAYEYADQIKADFVALTGDYVPNRPFHGFSMLHSVVRNAKLPTVYTIGNHDVAGLTDEQAYEQNIAPIREVLQVSEKHAYYYRDFRYGEETVRVISLYPFYEKAASRTRGYYTEEQLVWLCEVMATVPDGGHIFILRHFSHHKTVLLDEEKNMFYDHANSNTEDGINLWLNMGSDPVTEIVDAYNNRSSIFAQYTGELKDHTETVTVKYDFSSRPNSEFVAYFTGHIHADAVGYARNTKTRQAVLSSLCTIGWKGTENYHAYTSVNTPRDYGTDSQIAFNVFTFDFENKKIYVARVGNGLFKDREKTYMELTYQ